MNLIQVLTTPNEAINNILTFLFTFFEGFLYLKLITATLSLKPSCRNSIIFVIIAASTALLTNSLLKNPYSYLINISILFASIYFLLCQNLKSCVIALLITYISVFISTFTVQILLSLLFNISYTNLITTPLFRFLACIIIYTGIYFIYIIIKHRHNIFNFIKLSLKTSLCQVKVGNFFIFFSNPILPIVSTLLIFLSSLNKTYHFI